MPLREAARNSVELGDGTGSCVFLHFALSSTFHPVPIGAPTDGNGPVFPSKEPAPLRPPARSFRDMEYQNLTFLTVLSQCPSTPGVAVQIVKLACGTTLRDKGTVEDRLTGTGSGRWKAWWHINKSYT